MLTAGSGEIEDIFDSRQRLLTTSPRDGQVDDDRAIGQQYEDDITAAAAGAGTTSPLLGRLRDLLVKPRSSRLAQAYHVVVFSLIVAAICGFVVGTIPGWEESSELLCLEVLITVCLSVDVALRFAVAESAEDFATDPLNIVDLVALSPGYIRLVWWWSGVSLSRQMMLALQTFRLFWFMRILWIIEGARYSPLFSLAAALIQRSWTSGVALMVAMLFFLMIVSASVLHVVESDRCEKLGIECSGFDSIPAACWYAISTLTTVGYGDQIPHTALGKMVGGATAALAVICLAMVVAMLTYFFEQRWRVDSAEASGRMERLHTTDLRQQELHDLYTSVRASCNGLVDQLMVAATRRLESKGEEAPLVMMPMLHSIEARAAVLCSEMHSMVHPEREVR